MEKLQLMMAPYIGYVGESPWLQALVMVLGSWLVAWIVDRVVMKNLIDLLHKISATLDLQLLQLLRRPVFFSLVLLGLGAASQIVAPGHHWQTILSSVLVTMALIIWTTFMVRFLRMLLRKMAANPSRYNWLHFQTLPLFENLAYIFVVVLSVYYIFSAWNIDMTAWLASAGIVGIAVGFAAKDTLANLFSGAFILADAPYKIGDFVVLDSGERGEITGIGLRSTRMLTRDDVEVTIPNSVMGNTKIINESGGPHEKYRVRVKVGVAYGSDIDLVREVLLGVAAAEESLCDDPEPRVRLRQFGASSLDFELLCWVDQPVLQGRILDSLHCRVYKRFIEEGIEIPYSKQDLYIKELPGREGADKL